MKFSCRHIQDALIDQLLGQLPEEQKPSVAEHTAGCPACRRFRDTLKNQDQMLSQWSRTMQDSMAQKAQKAAAAFLARQDVKPRKGIGTFVYYAAAAVLIVGVLLGLLWLLHLRPQKPKQEFVSPGIEQQLEQPPEEKQIVSPEGPQQPESKEATAEKELQLAKVLFENGNVKALAALYQAGGDPTRQAVLNYLAQMATEEALRTLAELMEAQAQAADPNLLSEAKPASEQTTDLSAAESAAGEKPAAIRIEEQDYYDPEAMDADNWQTGVLGIRVIDDKTGQPIPGAEMEFSIRPKAEIPEKAKTNQFGRYELRHYNPQAEYIWIKVRKLPYVGLRLTWNPGTGIPLQYQVRMKEGVPVGGIVETTEGQPLEGVKIDVSVYIRDETEIESPMVDDDNLMSDSQGRWLLERFPADLGLAEFSISVEHPEYVSVERYSIQPDPKSLFEKRCVIQMRKGLAVGGQITDAESRPIEGAMIYTGFSRYDSDKRETKTDALGRYEFTNCKARDLVLTVMAAGYAPDLREVAVSETLGDVNFQLGPGYSVTVHVVDRNGNGIEGVKVEGDEWRTYGTGNQEARTIRCSAKTNAIGHATLTDLPADAVKYYVRKSGYASYNEFIMTADQQAEYTVVMLPEGKLTGRVLDGETGLPVSRFHMIEGIDWSNEQNPTWQSHRGKICDNGMYEQKLYYQDLGLAVRIEAEGYLPAESASYINEGKQIVEDIVLYKGQGPSGVVLFPDGQPAFEAQVCARNQDHYVNIQNGRISRDNRPVSDQTDEEGRFQLPPITAPYCLVVLHDVGGAVVSGEKFEQSGAITLQPWSTVEGTVYLNNKPAANQNLSLHSSFNRDECEHISVTSKAMTDENGKFSCGRLFPGRIQVSRMVPLGDGSSRYMNTMFVHVEPGQTAEVVIGQGGRTVVGRLNLTGDMKGNSAEHIDLTISGKVDLKSIDYPEIELPETYLVMTVEEKQQWQQQLMETPAWKEYMKKMEESQGRGSAAYHESVIVESGGTLRAENIPPGEYWLSGSIGDPAISRYTAEWYQNRLGQVKYQFTVPEGAEDTDYEKPIDLGSIPIEPFKKLQAGQAAPAIEMTDMQGNPISLEDFRGKYLLVDLGMFMQIENPQAFIDTLKSAYKEFHEPGRLEILTVIVGGGTPSMTDSIYKATRYFVKNQKIAWPIGFINPAGQEDLYPLGPLYPSMFLIDPDGRLEALQITPEELPEILKEHLKPLEEDHQAP